MCRSGGPVTDMVRSIIARLQESIDLVRDARCFIVAGLRHCQQIVRSVRGILRHERRNHQNNEQWNEPHREGAE